MGGSWTTLIQKLVVFEKSRCIKHESSDCREISQWLYKGNFRTNDLKQIQATGVLKETMKNNKKVN